LKLVVGLGNPGPQYARTRHNAGFLVAEALARSAGLGFAAAKKYSAELAEGQMGGEKVWILKPQTFMNLSGESVGAAARFCKVGLEDVVVAHDDLELERFRVQIKVGGGHSGHNGLKSLQDHLGGADFVRVRVGIGRPPPPIDPSDFVLGRFGADEEAELGECVARAAEAAQAIVELGVARAMNDFNRRR
jgi:PTH1 family peptidyl-tRNA hydrolase